MTPPDPPCADSDDRDEATLRFYDDQAAVYAAHAPDQASRHLAGFQSRLAAGARILELGCGGGRDSRAMLDQGFDLDPTDGSPAIAREASARLGRPVRVLRFDQLDAVAAYDAVWAHASLLHVPRAGLPGVLARIFRSLRPGGLHFANFKGGGAEGRDGHGRYFNYLSAQQVGEAYARSAAWDVLSIEEGLGGGYDGRQGPWIAITVRRPDGASRA